MYKKKTVSINSYNKALSDFKAQLDKTKQMQTVAAKFELEAKQADQARDQAFVMLKDAEKKMQVLRDTVKELASVL